MALRPSPAPALAITGITTARQKAGALRADGLLAVLDIVMIQLRAALRAGVPNPLNYWHGIGRAHGQAGFFSMAQIGFCFAHLIAASRMVS
jgi:hypothetical protein